MTLLPARVRALPSLCAVALLALATPAWAQTGPLRGVLHVVWDAETDARHAHARRFFLLQDDGRSIELLPRSADAADAEALESRDRLVVEVAGEGAGAAPGGVEAIRVRSLREVGRPFGEAPAAASVAAKDFVTVLCRFADDASTPFTPATVAQLHGPTYPGVRQYYAELSRDPSIMSGSAVTQWYTLPLPRSSYVSGTTTNFGALVQDCTAAADADVDFTGYHGINLQLNGYLSTRATPPYDPLSFGGSWTLTRDGQTRTWGVTWLSGEHHDNYVVLTHEMGHALGWPHSSGKYGSEYDSRWDVMSVGYLRWEPPYGWLTIHTIAHHKNLAGWIPSQRRWVPAEGTVETATIVRSAIPPAAGHLMAEIPLPGGRSYTVEARRLMGHDTPLPAEAIVIHETSGSRAWVVDPDNNGNPNDAAAAWLPGETFTDVANGISVTVEQELAEGFSVTIHRGGAPTCSVSVAVDPAGAGTAAVTAGGETGACGRSVTVTAQPGAGWSFQEWREGGSAVSSNAAYTFASSADRALVASFVRECTVSVAADPAAGGSATVTAGGATGDCGRSVTVSATPAARWRFLRWTEGGAEQSTSAAYAFTVGGSRALVAHFEEQCAVAVSADPAAGGTVAVGSGGESGACGRAVTVTATPAAGWGFVRWSEGGAAVSTSPVYTFTATSDRSLVGLFERQCAIAVAASPAAGGTASVTGGGAAGACGRSVTVTATPSTGWVFLDWSEAGAQVGTTQSHVLTLDADRSLTASFVGAEDLASRTLQTLFGTGGSLSQPERSMLDREGNQNGTVDLGDFLAFLDRNPGVSPGGLR